MPTLLDRAIAEMRSLPPDEQDAIAGLVLDELADEAAWQAKFARSCNLIDQLAAAALAEDTQGLTTPLEFDRRQ